jgi:type II secretory pathway pseudopilin PulG
MTGRPRRRRHQPRGFSLVEVTVAIGITAFCLLAVVGLLPTGLKSIKSANEQAGAANVLGSIADALRNAASTDDAEYVATFGGKEFSYIVGGGNSSTEWENLSLTGAMDADGGSLRARLDILQAPSADPPLPGRAVVSVAWPAQASPAWAPDTQTWSKAEGFVTMGLQFLPAPRSE